MITLEFLITSFLIVLAPGAGAVYSVSAGITQGRKASIFAALGSTAGIVPHLLATVLGLGAIMHASATAFSVMKYVGVAYLLYVAYVTFKDKSAFAVDSSVAKTSPITLFNRAFLTGLFNPKLTIFFLAFLPQFVNPVKHQPMAHLLILSAVFMVMTFIVFVAYGLLAHSFRRLVVESAKARTFLRYGFSAAIAGLGARLAVTD
jgi:threonine/homoserine/homoserine lactone efflux protein